MTNTIETLWNGNIDPTRQFGRGNPEIRKLEQLMRRHLDQLEVSLSEKQAEAFEKYQDCDGEYYMLSCQQAFCDGFCMGMKLCAEALVGTAIPE